MDVAFVVFWVHCAGSFIVEGGIQMRMIRLSLMYVGLAISLIPLVLAVLAMPDDLVSTEGDTD